MFTTKNLSRFVIILLTVIFCSLITETAFAMATDGTDGAVLYVKVGGNGDCSSWERACELQTALATASSGDQIWVAAGTYKPTTTTDRTFSFVLKSGVAIYGGFPAEGGDWSSRDWETNTTTLSGDIGIQGDNNDNSYHVVTASNIDNTAVLDGFDVTAGNANNTNSESNRCGGGIYNISSSLRLTNVIFYANTASYDGAGMYNYNHSNPMLINVAFFANTASRNGAGMANYNYSSPTLTNVIFSGNTASYYAGGLSNVNSSPILTNVIFYQNTSLWQGGGMYNENSSPTLTNLAFFSNTAMTGGGGMFTHKGNPTLTDVTFFDNSDSYYGGGMYNYDTSPMLTNVTFFSNRGNSGGGMYNFESSPTLINVTFSTNTSWWQGGGMYNENGNPILTNVTMVNNSSGSGGGIFSNAEITIINSILWGNTPDQVNGGTPIITYSDIQGGFSGEGNLNLDPLLGPLEDNGGFTLTHALMPGSPAIDAGSPDNCPSHDQRGYPRPIDGNGDNVALCDMGAYEYGEFLLPHIFLPLIQR